MSFAMCTFKCLPVIQGVNVAHSPPQLCHMSRLLLCCVIHLSVSCMHQFIVTVNFNLGLFNRLQNTT